MKIVTIGPFPPLRGGISDFHYALFKQLSKNNDVSVINFKKLYPNIFFPGKTQYEEGEGPKGIEILPIINSVNPFNWFKIAKRVMNEKPDYVIIRYWLPFMAPCLE
mgnify:CR=1 FL=1